MQTKPDGPISSAPGTGNSGKSRKTKGNTPSTKTDLVIALLARKQGASLADMTKATGWQPHSVRSFLSAALRKRMGLNIASEQNAKGVRRYRIADEPAA